MFSRPSWKGSAIFSQGDVRSRVLHCSHAYFVRIPRSKFCQGEFQGTGLGFEFKRRLSTRARARTLAAPTSVWRTFRSFHARARARTNGKCRKLFLDMSREKQRAFASTSGTCRVKQRYTERAAGAYRKIRELVWKGRIGQRRDSTSSPIGKQNKKSMEEKNIWSAVAGSRTNLIRDLYFPAERNLQLACAVVNHVDRQHRLSIYRRCCSNAISELLTSWC